MASAARPRLPYDAGLLAPAPGRPRLVISDQVVHDVLFAQPRGKLPAAELAELFGVKTGAERDRLLKVVARVGELTYSQNGVPIVRLKKAPGVGCARKKPPAPPASMAPLPIEGIEVRRVLLVQPGYQMEVGRLRALFAPQGEAQRQALTVAISSVAEIVRGEAQEEAPPPVVVRLKRPDWLMRRGAGANDKTDGKAGADAGHGHETAPPAGTAHPCNGGDGPEGELPVTSVERELIENLLRCCPHQRMESEELVRLLAPSGEEAWRPPALTVRQPQPPPPRRGSTRPPAWPYRVC